MLTRENFLKLWETVQNDGDIPIKCAADLEAIMGMYAAELIHIDVTDSKGRIVRTLKWDELPRLYRLNIMAALLVEYGRNRNLQIGLPDDETRFAEGKTVEKPVSDLYPNALKGFSAIELLEGIDKTNL